MNVRNSADYQHVGYVSKKLRHKENEFFYSAHVTGPKWALRPYWTPAAGVLSCNNCSLFGEAYMMARDNKGGRTSQSKPSYPRSAKARIESGGEFFQLSTYDRHNIVSTQGRDDIQIGPLSGYAVVYFVRKQPKHVPGTPMTGPTYRRLVTVYADDECAALHVTIGIAEERQQPPWQELESLLAELVIVKSATLALPDDVDIGSSPASPR